MDFKEYNTEDLLGRLNEVERKNAPARLFVAGHPEILRLGARVSIVGSRRASERGLETARVLSEMLAKQGVVVVSGLAAGIDTSAHWAAINAKGRTVAVLGTPLDESYPASNRRLQTIIMRTISAFRSSRRDLRLSVGTSRCGIGPWRSSRTRQ